MTSLIKAKALSRIKPSATIAITELGRELRAEGRDVISLSIGEPGFDTPEHVKEGARQAMLRGESKYSPIGGISELKSAIRKKFQRENQLEYTDKEVTVSAGGKQVLNNMFYATLNTGDEVIVPAPYWLAYTQSVLLYDARPVIVNTSQENGFKITPDALQAAITAKTKWLVINSPGNPTGSIYTRAELQALAEVLLMHPHVWIVSDDMYEHLIYTDEPFFTLAQVEPRLRSRTLTVNGVSKAYAMTGWRVGYAGGPAELIQAMELVQSQTTVGTSRICQWAAVAALNGPQDSLEQNLAIYRQRRSRLVDGLNAIEGVECLQPDGAFYAYPSCASFINGTTRSGQLIESDVDFCMALLKEEGVATVHGTAFGKSPHFRVSYAAADNELHQALERIASFCNSISRG